MEQTKPDFVHSDGEWKLTKVRFNSIPIILYRCEGDPSQVSGWSRNPRTDMVSNRWRLREGKEPDADPPDDEEMLGLMLEDDQINRGRRTFDIRALGEDVKLNGVRDAIIVDWDGVLLDGNRRKFAVMWALSSRTSVEPSVRELLSRIPMLVLPQEATQTEKDAIVSQENYASSMKVEWPEIITNGRLYDRYVAVVGQYPDLSELEHRQIVHQDFPRFSVTDILYRVQTWQLINEFRAIYHDDLRTDELDSLIDSQFQQFRQARDSFFNSGKLSEPEFKDLLFTGIRHQLFPSFAAVRALDDIAQSSEATEFFREGEGMSGGQIATNFRKARDEAGRARASSMQTVEDRMTSFMEFLDGLTSAQMAQIPDVVRQQLEETLARVIAQSDARPASE